MELFPVLHALHLQPSRVFEKFLIFFIFRLKFWNSFQLFNFESKKNGDTVKSSNCFCFRWISEHLVHILRYFYCPKLTTSSCLVLKLVSHWLKINEFHIETFQNDCSYWVVAHSFQSYFAWNVGLKITECWFQKFFEKNEMVANLIILKKNKGLCLPLKLIYLYFWSTLVYILCTVTVYGRCV